MTPNIRRIKGLLFIDMKQVGKCDCTKLNIVGHQKNIWWSDVGHSPIRIIDVNVKFLPSQDQF